MAFRVLDLSATGQNEEAALLASQMAESAPPESFFDLWAMSAMMSAKAGRRKAALKAWDKLAISAPHKLKWLEAAIRSAWSMETECPQARKKTLKWQKLLENVFIAVPSLDILLSMRQRGWTGAGAIGIHQNSLRGWILLEKGEQAKIFIDPPQKASFQLKLQPVASAGNIVLYRLELPFPENFGQCQIGFTDSRGKHVQGSPLVCSPAKIGKSQGARKVPTVIIPAYGDRKATIRCLASVLASRKKNKTPFETLVIWDCGPEKELLAVLERLAEKNLVKLLRNERNIGFLATVNRGLELIGDGDAILLNADTLVNGDWVDRLMHAAEKTGVATITALGNEAELMSFPSPVDRGKVKNLRQLRLLDSAAAKLETDRALIEIPVGVGFCMLITGNALRKIGGLDGYFLFRGYGEEVDFCLRAARAGMKNYGLFNLFVAHMGEKSFGISKKALAAQNNAAIHERFPEYRKNYENFLYNERPRELRQQLSVLALRDIEPLAAMEIRPWTHRYLPPWEKGENTRLPRNRGALFLRAGASPRALLRISTAIPLTDIVLDGNELPHDLAEILSTLSVERYINYCRAGMLRELAHKLAPDAIDASPEDADILADFTAGAHTYLAAPPLSPRQMKQLEAVAAKNRKNRFLVVRLENFWNNYPLYENMFPIPNNEDLSEFAPEAFIAPDLLTLADWRIWLKRHALGHLKIFRLPA